MMTRPYTKDMRQVATYLPPGAPDGFGGVTLGAPDIIKCRWQDKAELFRSSEGQELTSSAVVYVDRMLEPRGYLALGDFSGDVDSDGFLSLDDVPGAREIRQIGTSPSLRVEDELIKVWL